MSKAYLVLSDGSAFEGERFGADGDIECEIAFHTDVVGYMKTISNPEYAGKIVVQTFPMLGNYGAIPEELQGDVCVRGYVVREWCEAPSNFRSEGTMDAYFVAHGIVGICGIDTRAVTRRLRNGHLRARICAALPEKSNENQMGGELHAAE